MTGKINPVTVWGLLFLLCILSLPSFSVPESSVAAFSALRKYNMPVGMVIKASGSVFDINSRKEIHPLQERSVIYEHSLIVTKKDSTAALRFNDGSLIVVGPNSTLEIKTYRLTLPNQGHSYQGSPRDKAILKLYTGVIQGKLGSMIKVNPAKSFVLLTPRGRIILSDPKRSPDFLIDYNNRTGLIVKAVAIMNNSKGQKKLTSLSFGEVSAVIGSEPATTTTKPLALSEPDVITTQSLYDMLKFKVDTIYSDDFILEELSAKPHSSGNNATIPKATWSELQAYTDNVGDDDGNDAEDDNSIDKDFSDDTDAGDTGDDGSDDGNEGDPGVEIKKSY